MDVAIAEGQTGVLLTSFFTRLGTLDRVVKELVGGACTRLHITVRGVREEQIALDFSGEGLRVGVGAPPSAGFVRAAVPDVVLHDILLGRTLPGVAVGRRELLLRGSPSELVKVLPLFEFGPLLYREHLADVVGRDAPRCAGSFSPLEGNMQEMVFKGDPVPLHKVTLPEQLLFGTINAMAFGLGFALGVLRHRVFRRMRLFDVLASMSRGLQSATPRKRPT